MTFCAGRGAVRVLRTAVVVGSIVITVLLWLPSRWWLWWPWWVCVAPLPILGLLTVRYIPRLVSSFHGVFDAHAVRARYGLLWRRDVFVPLDSLRTYEVWTPPLHRLFGCRTVVLRFAGGAAWLPLLDSADAYHLTTRLEELEGQH